jgi:hypothetical protein
MGVFNRQITQANMLPECQEHNFVWLDPFLLPKSSARICEVKQIELYVAGA